MLCIGALDGRKIIGMTAPMSLTSIIIFAMATEELSPPFNVSNHRLWEQPLERASWTST